MNGFFNLLLGLLIATFIGVCGYGYVSNIVSLFTSMNNPITGTFLLRIVGVFFFPLGIFLGFV